LPRSYNSDGIQNGLGGLQAPAALIMTETALTRNIVMKNDRMHGTLAFSGIKMKRLQKNL
jgi:hypothetical protein